MMLFQPINTVLMCHCDNSYYNMKLATWIKKIEMLLSYEVRFFNLKVYEYMYINTHTTSYCCKSRHSNSY